ncbi:polymer-forming cytoskeletal protein [bacterium]|nr:polymer-forming cytoskeletal protein [bacterium]
MCSAIHRIASGAICLAVLSLSFGTAGAAPADSSAKAKPGQVQEIIVDDSGIIVREGESEYSIPAEAGEERLRVRVDTQDHRDKHSYADDDEQVSFGRDVSVESDEIVHNDLVILFGDLEVYGEVVGNVVVIMGDVYVREDALITGDVLVVGGEVERDEGARIVGEVTRTSSHLGGLFQNGWEAADFRFVDRDRFTAGDAVLKLLEFLVLALAGSLLLATRLPRFTAGVRYRPWRSLLIGFLSSLAILLLAIPAVLVLILLLLTIVAIPVVVLAILALVGLGFAAWLIPLYAFSRYTFEIRGMNRYLAVAIWAGIFWLFHMFGHLGGPVKGLVLFVEIVAWCLGLGALVITRLGSRHLLADPS